LANYFLAQQLFFSLALLLLQPALLSEHLSQVQLSLLQSLHLQSSQAQQLHSHFAFALWFIFLSPAKANELVNNNAVTPAKRIRFIFSYFK